MVDCAYCKYIKPELQGTKSCPECHGNSTRFKAMRMMDRATSEQEILLSLLDLRFDENYDKLRSALIHLLTQVEVYNFNLKSALINFLQANEPTDPVNG